MNIADGNAVVIPLNGRIGSDNAAETEKKITAILDENTGKAPVFDAYDLEYISSAGLRVLLKLGKSSGKKLEIRNVSPEVYEILEVTGFTEIFSVKKRPREISVEGCEVIGHGFFGTVYRLDADTIVKVYRSSDSIAMIENEKKMAKIAFLKGIPTAISYDIVRVGDAYGSVFEMLKAETFNDLLIKDPSNADDIIKRYVDFLKYVHKKEDEEEILPSARETFLGYLEKIKPYLTDEQYRRLKELLMSTPETCHIVHGDFQMKNVMLVDGEPMLIDMDTLSRGHPAFDLQSLYMTYEIFEEDDPQNGMDFLGIDNEMCDLVWRKILEYYVGTDDEKTLEPIRNKIRTLAAIRFLYLLTSTDLKNGALGQTRIRHTQEHLKELLPIVESLIF